MAQVALFVYSRTVGLHRVVLGSTGCTVCLLEDCRIHRVVLGSTG